LFDFIIHLASNNFGKPTAKIFRRMCAGAQNPHGRSGNPSVGAAAPARLHFVGTLSIATGAFPRFTSFINSF